MLNAGKFANSVNSKLCILLPVTTCDSWMVSPLGVPPAWIENGSCHHPLLETDAEYLVLNSVTWDEVIRSVCLLLVSLLILVTNLCLILSLSVVGR